MIRGIGTDIIEIKRLEPVLERLGDKFVQRILTPAEIVFYQNHKMPVRMLAKRFAAKEAVAKALGTGIGRGVSWQDMELKHNDSGAPIMELSGGAAERMHFLDAENCFLSLSDEKEYAVAFAIIE